MTSENQNKKLMFISVGVGGGDGSDIAHALFYTIKHCNPDAVVFLASAESWDKVSVHLLPQHQEFNGFLLVEKEIVNEIDDFQYLHNEFSEIILNYYKKGFKNQYTYADYTSGTKAMSAALVSAAIFNKIDTLTYVTGRREKGRVLSGTERQYPLSTSSIISWQTINEAVIYFNRGMYKTVIQMLGTSTIYPQHKNKAETIIGLSKFLDAWDKFNFTQAFEIIRSIDEDVIKQLNLFGKIKKLKNSTLPILIKEELSYEKIDDLLFNAKRRADEGKYDDAVARIYRAVEMTGQLEFKKEFNCTTSSIKIENLGACVAEAAKLCSRNDKGEYQAGLFQTFNLLSETENKCGKIFKQNAGEFRKLLDNRNYSILAHGSQPITEKQFERFYDFVTEKFRLAEKGNRNASFSFPVIKDLRL